ncbi:DUF2785 domain-containing protein [Terrabacter sp. 2YAF2]|uniref:DUF2785 domain-containing protein n=1 Tax=Terrabacter sp. 2YAF2 TaxID=3233026 RepID=UPI003F961ABD
MPDTSLRTLVDDLASPDPAVRDDGAYATLTRLVRDGDLPLDDRSWLGDAMVQRLRHERAEARSFAPLVLASLVAVGDLDEAWIPAVTRWFCNEQDLRGHDPELGWVHTVAHGADFFGACGAAGVGDPAALLDALARRIVVPTTFVWRDQEDDRVAHALALVLARPDVDEPTAVDWLERVRSLFASGSPGPVPPEASNTMRTLRSLHVALGEQPLQRGEPVTVQHCELVRTQVAAVLHEVTPWSWRTRAGR